MSTTRTRPCALHDVERGDDAADSADGHGEIPRRAGGGGHLDAGGDGVSRSGNGHVGDPTAAGLSGRLGVARRFRPRGVVTTRETGCEMNHWLLRSDAEVVVHDRQSSKPRRGPGRSPAVTDPREIRNVVLVGPSGAGKTTLVEALLAHTAASPARAAVADGTTVCDHDPAAVRQQRSVALAVAPCCTRPRRRHEDQPDRHPRLRRLRRRAARRAARRRRRAVRRARLRRPGGPDRPGHRHAVGGVRRGRDAARRRRRPVRPRPRRPGGDGRGVPGGFGAGVAPLYLPMRDGESVTGLYGLISQTPEGAAPAGRRRRPRHAGRGDHRAVRGRDAHGALPRRRGHRHRDADRRPGDGRRARHPSTRSCRSARSSGIGLDALLEVLIGGFPSPLEHPLPPVSGIDGSAAARAHGRPRTARSPPRSSAPRPTPTWAGVARAGVLRHAARRHHDARQRARTPLDPDAAHVVLDDGGHDADERLAHVYSPLGATLNPVEACGAGDICALTKLGSAETGDTVSASDDPLLLVVLEPARAAAAGRDHRPHPGATRTRWCKTLAKIVAADPTLRLERNQETHQTVLWCMGEAHADVVLSRLRAGRRRGGHRAGAGRRCARRSPSPRG